jgi:hypothetical protein
MTSLQIWLAGLTWLALSGVFGSALGTVLHRLGRHDTQASPPQWDDVADLDRFNAEHPDNTGIRRAAR